MYFLKELNQENDHPLYRTRLVSVYKDLTDQQARRLAAKHNHATSLHHDMTTWDKVQYGIRIDFVYQTDRS